MNFPQQLTSLRYQLNWSQEKVAKIVPGGVTAQTVGRWERGQNLPNETTQQFLVNKLKAVIEAEIRQENEAAYVADVDALARLKENPMTLDDFATWFESLPPPRKLSVWGIVKAHIPPDVQNTDHPNPARTSSKAG